MDLYITIRTDLKNAMKSGDTLGRDALRMLDSALKNEEIASSKRQEGLAEKEIIATIKRLVKQRIDSAQQYRSGGRAELAHKEEQEIVYLEKYLPSQMSDEDLRVHVDRAIKQSGATGRSDAGKVMGQVMRSVDGGADGGRVKALVDEVLGDV